MNIRISVPAKQRVKISFLSSFKFRVTTHLLQPGSKAKIRNPKELLKDSTSWKWSRKIHPRAQV